MTAKGFMPVRPGRREAGQDSVLVPARPVDAAAARAPKRARTRAGSLAAGAD
jgi:hypothetical protein